MHPSDSLIASFAEWVHDNVDPSLSNDSQLATGTDDEFINNASSFVREMKETAFIVQSCSNNSLVIIDELGRGQHSSIHDTFFFIKSSKQVLERKMASE